MEDDTDIDDVSGLSLLVLARLESPSDRETELSSVLSLFFSAVLSSMQAGFSIATLGKPIWRAGDARLALLQVARRGNPPSDPNNLAHSMPLQQYHHKGNTIHTNCAFAPLVLAPLISPSKKLKCLVRFPTSLCK